jgi:hypothetical protein
MSHFIHAAAMLYAAIVILTLLAVCFGGKLRPDDHDRED